MAIVNRGERKNRKGRNNNSTGKNIFGVVDSTVYIPTDVAPNFSDVQIKTFAEQAIDVLNHLDEVGIDIYAEGRTGGMYLKDASRGISAKDIFKKKEETDEIDSSEIFKK